MTQTVVVTGMGCITAAGLDLETTWQSIGQGQTGLAPITLWDAHEWEFPIAGEVKNADPRQLINDRKLLKVISRHDVFGIHAVSQAVDDSQIKIYRESLDDPETFNYRSGLYVGAPGSKFEQQNDFLPLMHKAENNMQVFADHLFETIHPMWLLRILPNNVLAYAGIMHGFKGPNENITNHAVSGAQALLEATHAIREGRIDRAIVVAYDSSVEPQGVGHYGRMGLLSKRGVYSFDASHDGTAMGEGAGAIILESKDAALARGAKIYAQVLGGASTSDAKGIFSVDTEGDGVRRALQAALTNAHCTADQIGMICAHGNGVPRSDESEALALSSVFDTRAVPVTGFKWSLGHTLAASGLIDTILTIKALSEDVVPGIATFERIATRCQPISVSSDHQQPHSDKAAIITRGFSGMTTSVIIQGKKSAY